MKKFLLTLIVTMLTCIGAWAQETILIDAGDGVAPSADFKLEAHATVSNSMQVGDLLRIYYHSNSGGYTYCDFGYDNNGYNFMFEVNTNQGDSDAQTWTYKDVSLTSEWISNIQNYGLKVNGWSSASNITLQKLTFIHYDAPESVSLNESSITLGIGSTYNLLKATVNPSTANQTVDWSVVSGGESIVSVDANGVITGLAAGDAYVRATVPGTSYYADCFVKVQKGFKLTLAADKTTVLNTDGGTVNITPTVSLEGESPVEGEDYDIDYSIPVNADPTNVTIDGKVITIKPGAVAGTYTVVAELDPVKAEFAGATATMDFVVDAPLTDAMHFEIDDQTFGKSQGTKEIELILKIDNGTFANLSAANHSFSASSDGESVVTANWKAGTANEYNNTIVFTINGVGEAHVTLTDQATKDGKVAIATKTITVTVTGDPLHFTMGSLTVNDDQALSLDAIKAAVTKVYTEVNSTQTDVDPANYGIEVYKDDAKVETSIPAQGSEVSSFNITVKVKATNENYTDAEQQIVPVTVTHKKSFTLNLDNIDKTTIKANIHEKATINPTSKYNDEDVAVEYSCVSSDPTVATAEVVDGKIVVTAQKEGTVTITVTATPIGDDAANYAPMTETISIEVTQSWVTLSKETIEGKEYVVVNVPVGGAFGPISDEPTTVVENGASLAELRVAENVKVTGSIANSDMRELIHLIGDSNETGTNPQGYCYTLDMGEAQMTEAIDVTITNDQNWTHSWIDNYYGANLWLLENLTLPQPHPDYTVIPTGMNKLWNENGTAFKSLSIPNGWTEVGDHAFTNLTGNGLKALTSLTLGNSITKIGSYAFAHASYVTSLVMPTELVEIKDNAFFGYESVTHLELNDKLEKIGAFAFRNLNSLKVLNMPYNIKRIDEHAFDPANALEDVYFYGHAPSFVHTFAFGGDKQMANNTVNDQLYNEKYDPTTTRFNYQVAGVLACLLHYPKEYESEYIDVTRVYEKRNPHELYHKGNQDNKYTMPGWTSEVISAISTHPQHNSNAKIEQYVDYGVKDQYYGDNMIWPSQSQMTMGFALAQGGYKWIGDPLDADQYDPEATYENGGIDKRGLFQFITTMGNATIAFSYEQEKWYTIALPFNMSPDEIKRIFGDKTQVCRFSKVERQATGDEKEIRLEFRNSVMEDVLTAGTDYVGTYYKPYTGIDAENKPVTEPAFTKPGIIHHYPYMIKPSGTVNEDPAIRIEGTKRIFNGHGFERISGTLHGDEVLSSDEAFYYEFSPILESGTFKPYSYVFVDNAGHHEYVFYKGRKCDDMESIYIDKSKPEGYYTKDDDGYILANGEYVYIDGGRKNQNTAYVQLPTTEDRILRGHDDYLAFFASTPSSLAPINASVFGDEEVTGIERVVIVCGTDEVEDNKVYTINGQLVNSRVLAPGLYIKNGKKFIVK